jgi:hypothetical protein
MLTTSRGSLGTKATSSAGPSRATSELQQELEQELEDLMDDGGNKQGGEWA